MRVGGEQHDVEEVVLVRADLRAADDEAETIAAQRDPVAEAATGQAPAQRTGDGLGGGVVDQCGRALLQYHECVVHGSVTPLIR